MCLFVTLIKSSEFMWFYVCAKNPIFDFTDKSFREGTISSEDFFIPGSFFFTWRRSCQRMEHCCSDTAVAKHWPVFVDFWDDKDFFLG